jgi:Flp pilus assembly pilin Flp
MKTLMRLWQEDDGAILATEYLFVTTILIIGLVVGLTGLRSAINAELTELANAILALSQGYSVNGQMSADASVDGSQAFDMPDLLQPPQSVPAFSPSLIDVPVAN